MQPQIGLKPRGADDGENFQKEFAHAEQHDRTADHDLIGDGNVEAGRQKTPDLPHVPIGAHRDEQIEGEGNADEADRLDRAQGTAGGKQGGQGAGNIERIGDAGAWDVEMRNVVPGPGELPKAGIIIAHEGEDRQGERVKEDGGRSEGLGAGGKSPRGQPRRAEQAGRPPILLQERCGDRACNQRRTEDCGPERKRSGGAEPAVVRACAHVAP